MIDKNSNSDRKHSYGPISTPNDWIIGTINQPKLEQDTFNSDNPSTQILSLKYICTQTTYYNEII